MITKSTSASFPLPPWYVLRTHLPFAVTDFPDQSSRIEILNEGGYRSDGRRQYELRDMDIDMAAQGSADGAATLFHGLTQVQVAVHGPREAKIRSQTMYDRANVNVELSIAPFSTGERRKRARGDKSIFSSGPSCCSPYCRPPDVCWNWQP